jgi:flagellar protein FlaJ
MSQVIPFSPLPPPIMRKFARRLIGWGSLVAVTMPFLNLDLKQAEIDFDVDEYGAIVLIIFLFYLVVFSLLVYFIALSMRVANALTLAPAFGFVLALLVAFQVLAYPRVIVKRKVRELEQNLIFALRTMLVQLRSGIPLYGALRTVAEAKFGRVSLEFHRAIEEISTGTREETALQKLAMRNPSWFFRKSLWQIVNGLKTGTDISLVLADIVESMTNEEEVQIRTYGGSLRVLSLVYMLLGVIIPALGITFFIVISSFPQIEITEISYWTLLAGLIVGQVAYLGLMKSKRPTLLEA